jgi:hypothetical protein
LSSSTLTLASQGLATTTSPGLVSTVDQTFAGSKTFNGSLKLAGGLIQSVRTVNSSGNLLSTDNLVIAAPNISAITLTLPTAVNGLTITVKRNSASYLVYLVPASGTIDGLTTVTLSSNYQSMTVVSDGTNWFII